MRIMNRIQIGLILFLLMTIILSMHGFSQVVCRGVEIGKRAPAAIWSYKLQHPRQATLDMYSDRLVILDFWAAWCTPCVKSIPELSTLQKAFPQILCVLVNDPDSGDDTSRIRAVTDKYPLAHFKGDKALSLWFAHQQIPHYVWIDKGTYIGATGKVTVELLRFALQFGQLPHHVLKHDFITP